LGACLHLSASCGNEILSESTSPNGCSTVTIVRKDCGTITGYLKGTAVRFSGTSFSGKDKCRYMSVFEG
jgi:hypothetical protein